MRQLTTYERKVGRINGTIIVLRRELKKDRLRHRIQAVKKAAIEFLIIAAAVAAWVLIMDQLLKAKGL